MTKGKKDPAMTRFLKRVALPVLRQIQNLVDLDGRRARLHSRDTNVGLEIWSNGDRRLDLTVIPEVGPSGVRAHLCWKPKNHNGKLGRLTELPFPPWKEIPEDLTRQALFDFLALTYRQAFGENALEKGLGARS